MEKKKSRYRRRLTNKYKVVILSDNNYEEKASFSLRGWYLLSGFSLIFVLFFILTFGLIAYTPIKEYVPGFDDVQTTAYLSELLDRTDSMQQSLIAKQTYVNNLRNLLSGDVFDTTITDYASSNIEIENDRTADLFRISTQDSILRRQIESRENIELTYNQNLNGRARMGVNKAFFPPVRGIITEGFNPAISHYAVDVVSASNTGIKATLDGVVIFAEWSATTGHVIILQHADNLLSVYKHNDVLLKKVGNFVRAGEVIGIIGDSGSLTTGPHLHFELWQDGRPLNPEDYIVF